MRSVKKTFSIPTALLDAFEMRSKSLGYPSISAYFVSLGIYDLLISKPHDATGDIHTLPILEQDKLHDGTARRFTSGETLGGTWYAHQLDAAVKAAGKEPDKNRLRTQLFKQISE